MSLTITGTWDIDVWEPTVWADGVWYESFKALIEIELIDEPIDIGIEQ